MTWQIKRIVSIVLLLYLLLVAVDVTAANPESRPLSLPWARAVLEHMLEDARRILLQLATLRDALMTQGEPAPPEPTPEAQDTWILPPLAGLNQEIAADLLSRLEITNVKFLEVPNEQCRRPGVVVATLPVAGTHLQAEDSVAVFVCEGEPTPTPVLPPKAKDGDCLTP